MARGRRAGGGDKQGGERTEPLHLGSEYKSRALGHVHCALLLLSHLLHQAVQVGQVAHGRMVGVCQRRKVAVAGAVGRAVVHAVAADAAQCGGRGAGGSRGWWGSAEDGGSSAASACPLPGEQPRCPWHSLEGVVQVARALVALRRLRLLEACSQERCGRRTPVERRRRRRLGAQQRHANCGRRPAGMAAAEGGPRACLATHPRPPAPARRWRASRRAGSARWRRCSWSSRRSGTLQRRPRTRLQGRSREVVGRAG